ncbi:MAG: hypothetical protein OS112_05845 [Methanoregula sp.]|nr:MAG: hypothetical protein OS112_05845 [Methanoregula sp.]
MDIFQCILAVAYRRCPDGYLLQFAHPCGNGKKIETIDMVSSIDPRFPARINSPKSVIIELILPNTQEKMGTGMTPYPFIHRVKEE